MVVHIAIVLFNIHIMCTHCRFVSELFNYNLFMGALKYGVCAISHHVTFDVSACEHCGSFW